LKLKTANCRNNAAQTVTVEIKYKSNKFTAELAEYVFKVYLQIMSVQTVCTVACYVSLKATRYGFRGKALRELKPPPRIDMFILDMFILGSL